MTYEMFAAEVETAIATLTSLRDFPGAGFGDGYNQRGVDISIPACEAAAEITGFDTTFGKMLNHNFRTRAAQYAMERAALKDQTEQAAADYIELICRITPVCRRRGPAGK